MLIFIVIDVPSARFMGNHHGIEMPLGGGIHRISSHRPPGTAPVADDRAAAIVRMTLKPPPHEATHWTARAIPRQAREPTAQA